MSKSKIVIYVFGPKRVYSKYNNGEVLNKENGEWIKIGLRRCPVDNDAYQEALFRCKQESKTGIPETSYIYDVFQFPNFTNRKIDDEIRRILQVFNIETSMQNNKFVNEDEIPAGQEFVYGITKQQVLHAIHSFSYQVLLEMDDKDREEMFSYMTSNNTEEDDVIEEQNNSCEIPEKFKKHGEFNRNFWLTIQSKLSTDVLKDYHVNPSNYKAYKHWSFKLDNVSFDIRIAYSRKEQFVIVCSEGLLSKPNDEFYNLVKENNLFEGLFTWRNWTRRTGEIEKQIIFYKENYINTPEEKIDEIVNTINKIYEYVNKHQI